MPRAIMLFTRDLRLRDNPALDAAIRGAEAVVPLFVLEDRLVTGDSAAPNRVRFLLESLDALRAGLRERGGDLVVRRGDLVTEVIKLAGETGAGAVFCADDVSAFAEARQHALAKACDEARVELTLCPGVTVVPPGDLRPSGGGDHFRVFTPYFRAWESAHRRAVLSTPSRVSLAAGLSVGRLPALASLTPAAPSPDHLMPGGEEEAQRRLRTWLRSGLGGYAEGHDDLAGDRTSRLSPYLHFGCLSPLQVADAAGPGEFRRQLAWRDFYHQVTAAFPAITRRDYRHGQWRWRDDRELFDAWRHGQTGVPIVDAGMRQLLAEGWMHNRARMIVASFLCKNLHIDWRLGARHFMAWLADGDVANNYGNWQWSAGTGNDTRPNRVLSPLRQSQRFDARGDYVRRYVSELADLTAPAIHQPWTLPAAQRRGLGYPDPVITL